MWCWFFWLVDNYILWSDNVSADWSSLKRRYYNSFFVEGDPKSFEWWDLAHFIFVLTFFSTVGTAVICFFYPPLMSVTNQILIFFLTAFTSTLMALQFRAFPCVAHLTLLLLYHIAFLIVMFYFATLVPLEIYDPLGLLMFVEARLANPFLPPLTPQENFLPFYVHLVTSVVFILFNKFQYPLFSFNYLKDLDVPRNSKKVLLYCRIVWLNRLMLYCVLNVYCFLLCYFSLRFLMSPVPIVASFCDYHVAHFSVHFFFGMFFLLFLHSFISWDLAVVPHSIWIAVWTKNNPEVMVEFNRNLREDFVKESKQLFWPLMECLSWSFIFLFLISFCASILYALYLGIGWFYYGFFYFLWPWILFYCGCLVPGYILFSLSIVIQRAWFRLFFSAPWKRYHIDPVEYKKALRVTYVFHLLEYSVVILVVVKIVSLVFFGIDL